MKQKIFILWASWNVWRELIKQVYENDSKKHHRNPSKIVWVADSKSYIFDSDWIEWKILEKIYLWRNDAKETFKNKWKRIWNLLSLLDLVKKEWLDWEVVFVDVTAWREELLEFHKALISETQNYLVTANKNPISLFSAEDFEYLTRYSWRYDTNTTVMWWAGVLNFVNERAEKIVDNIKNIQWMFSWTLWYILSKLELWEDKFSDIVREAKAKWYTEPNPWDDLNGLDVARKLIILARYAGHKVNISDIKISPLIDEKYANYEWEEFLEAIKAEDDYFEKKVIEARNRWEVLRYIWEMKSDNWEVKLTVGLKSVPKNSDLGTLDWTSNLAIVETDILEAPLPHVIKSRGAWLGVTAGAVRVWIAKMIPSHLVCK